LERWISADTNILVRLLRCFVPTQSFDAIAACSLIVASNTIRL
jgi:hypothetical protein